MSWWKRDWFFCLILAVVTMLAYQPAWHGGFIWDDDEYVTNNQLLTAPDGLRRIWFAFVDERTKRPWRFYWLALILYMLALSAKTTACTLPAALLLILWLQKKPINRERILQIAPFFLLGLGMGLVSVWWERYHQGT